MGSECSIGIEHIRGEGNQRAFDCKFYPLPKNIMPCLIKEEGGEEWKYPRGVNKKIEYG